MNAPEMTDMRYIICTSELPYPLNYGHKVDQYHRWRGFRDRGARLKLICWHSPHDPTLDAEHVEALRGIFDEIDVLPIRHDAASLARRLARLPQYPSHVASRIPSNEEMTRQLASARAFRPDAVVLDGIYGSVLGERMATECRVPVILRGHNIEYRYFAQQAHAMIRWRPKLATHFARLGLRRFEHQLVRRVAWNFDVSDADVRYWRAQGIQNVSWLPTVFLNAADVDAPIDPADKRWDVAYIGNLRLPNNLAGIAWFIEQVMPHIRRLSPGTSICFAGANPSQHALDLFAAAPDITLIPDAPSADAILGNGRVLVNPILSGSGITVKLIDMLRHHAPIVTTTVGARGFSFDLQRQFVVHDDAEDFARAVLSGIANPVPPTGRAEARALFSESALDNQMASFRHVIAGGTGSPNVV
jgi:hypothetical protein